MRELTIVAIAVAGLVAAVLGFTHSGVAADEPASAGLSSEAAAVVDRFFGALSTGDTSAANALLDPMVLIYESGGVERSRGEYAAHHLAADAAFLKSAKHRLISRNSDTVGELAWVATETRFMALDETPTDSVSTETMILRRQPSGWRIVHIHWSSRSPSHQAN